MVNDISKNKLLQQSLSESEKRFRLLTENSSDMISYHKLNGECKYVSPSCKKILGYNPEELIGKNILRLLHHADIDKILQTFKIAYSKPINVTVSFRIRKKDDSYIWCETSSRIIQNEITGGFEIQSSTRDITERKESEIQLNESFNSFLAVIESTNDIIWTVSAESFKT